MDPQSKAIKTVILGGERTGKTALVKKVSLARPTFSSPGCWSARVEVIHDNSDSSTVYTISLYR